MKSMQVVAFGEPLAEVDAPTPVPQDGQVLLRVRAAGICHTDLHLWHGGYDLGNGRTLSLSERGVKLPLTMGHETVGVVEAVGPQARGVQPGDVRLVFPWIGCGQCDACRADRENYCLAPNTIGINRAGGYADYMLVPDARYLVPLQGIDPVKAAPLACSGLTCFSALRKFDGERLGRVPLVIIGAGGLGLMSLALLRALGGIGGVVIEPDAGRRTVALQAGALAAIDPAAPDAVTQIRDAVGGPVWQVLDFVGNQQTAMLAFDVLTKGGHLVTVGLFGGAAQWPLPLLAIKALTIQGSYVGSLPELRDLVQLVAQHDLALIPTATVGLRGLRDALNALQQGNVTGRLIMTPQELS